MREAVIVASSRTPLAKSFRGSFNMTRPDDLAAHCIRARPRQGAAARCGRDRGRDSRLRAAARVRRATTSPASPRCGRPAGDDAGRHRQPVLQLRPAGHRAGGAHDVQEGVEAAIGGGVESITMMQRDNAPNPWVKEHYPGIYMVMGETAEVVAKRYGISREAQDEYALAQPAAHGARAAGRASSTRSWRRCRSRARVLDKKTGENRRRGARDCVERDECNRPDTTLEGLLKLPPVFDTTSGQGTVTAGNSSQLSDGASATLVMSSGARPGARASSRSWSFRGFAVAGCEPDEMGIGPVFAVPKLLASSTASRRRHRPVGAERGVRVAGRLLPRPAGHPDGAS